MRPGRSELARHWTLDPDVTFLNHGSFGATPRVVLEKQAELRARLEREPVKFMVRELEPMLDAARRDLGAFVGADASDIALVPNATSGVNAVLRSMHFEPGDELVVTDHEYNACRNALDFVAERSGARVVSVTIPLPVRSEDDLVTPIVNAVGRRTRLILIDHVTSPTAIVMPIARIAKETEVPLLVDGAHGPGQIDVDLSALGAAYYTANCHKWMCAPKGAAMLWVRKDLQPHVRPAVISHGANSPRTDRSRFLIEFDWIGTLDPTPWLCIGESLRTVAAMVPGGWEEVRARNHALAIEARSILLKAVGGGEPLCPESMLGAMAAVKVKDGGMELGDELFTKHGIEVPIMPFPCAGKRLVRVSAHLYNSRAEYEYLAAALR